MTQTYISFKVPSEIYGQTDCVINDVERAIKTGFAPCGDGCDYKLHAHQIEQLKEIAKGANPESFDPNVFLWHGTNITNKKSILKKGYFRPFAWFAMDKNIAHRYALMASKRTSSAVEIGCKIDPDALYCNGDYWSAKNKLYLHSDGVYRMTKPAN